MARPQKQGMDYFPHDTDASSDEKIDRMRMLYGNDGYAFFFILLERIYRSADFEIDVSDAETIQILARKVEVTPQKFAEMMQTALRCGCFCQKSFDDRSVLTSCGVKKRAETVTGKRQKMAERYKSEQQKVSDAETQQKPDKEKKRDTKVSPKGKQKPSGADAPKDDSKVTLTHKMRKVVEGLVPDYYWDGKDGKHAIDLADRLRNAFRSTQNKEPTDDDVLNSLKVLIEKSRNLSGYNRFSNIAALNERFNGIVSELRNPSATVNGQPQQTIHRPAKTGIPD